MPKPLYERVVKWIRGDALWDLVKITIGGIFGGKGASAMTNQSWLNVTLLLVGVALIVWAIFGKRIPRRSKAVIPPQTHLLAIQCADLAKQYKHLDHDYRDAVRYPMKDSSWPAAGELWRYEHLEMIKLRSALISL